MTLSFLAAELDRLQAAGLRRHIRVLASPQTPRVVVDGRELILLASNSYLGLSADPEVVQAAQQAVAAFGTGSGGSRLVNGTTQLHVELEQALAALKQAEDAVLFGTGYQANVGAITALMGPGDLILSDELNHASIIDGCRLSRATILVYRHRDVGHLAELLARERQNYRRALVVTDGVFSMDGDLAPLPELCAAAARHNALMMVDDAHATGVLGATGGGTVEQFGMHGQVHIQVGTLSKALASEGGFVAGSATLCQYLRQRARSFIFSTAAEPASVAAGLAAVRIIQREPERMQRLHANAAFLRQGLRALGYSVPDGETPVIPVLVGEAQAATALAQALEEAGAFAPAIRPPSVPPGTSRLRVTVMATHTHEDLEDALAAFAAAGRQAEVIA